MSEKEPPLAGPNNDQKNEVYHASKIISDHISTTLNESQQIIDLKQKLSDSQNREYELSKKLENTKNNVFIQRISDLSLGLLAASQLKDNETHEHTVRIGAFSGMLASQLREAGIYIDQINQDFIDHIIIKAPLHDIGKVSIPDNILFKPGKLSKTEFEIIKEHTTVGYEKLESLEASLSDGISLSMSKNITLYHHEKWNGKGYPKGLKGNEIPLEARVVAVVDVFDAIMAKRPYKEAFSPKDTLDLMIQGMGTHFDPKIVRVFIKNFNEYISTRNQMLGDNER